MDPAEALVRFLLKKEVLRNDVERSLWDIPSSLPILALSRKNLINQQAAIQTLCDHFEMEQIDLESLNVLNRLQSRDFRNSIQNKFCWEHRLVPLFDDEHQVSIAMANPFDQQAVKSLSFQLSKPIRVYVAEESKITALLARLFPQHQIDIERAAAAEESSTGAATGASDVEELDQLCVDAPPIVRLVNELLTDAIKHDSSDIHLEPGDEHLSVRFRIDGALQNITTIPRKIQASVTARLKVLSGMDIAERRRPQDGRFCVSLSGRRVDIRVSAIPVAEGEKIVMRVLRSDYESLNFSSLGIPDSICPRLEEALQRRGKLVLVSGPTGSGKTTTLYVALNSLREGTLNITTIEDPIEYKFPYLNQIQVNEAADVNFASVLRAVLRQDPDVIMIGEIRDQDTVNVVMQAAQTGHLVLSTVHTNDAPSAIYRLFDLGAEPYHVATALSGVLAQRLVRLLCQKCSTPATPDELQTYKDWIDLYQLNSSTIYHERGCAECFYTGFHGRAGLYSYFEVTDTVSSLIQAGAPLEKIVAAAQKEGFRDLDVGATELIRDQKTSLSEILPYLKRGTSLTEVPAPAESEEVDDPSYIAFNLEPMPGAIEPAPTTSTSVSHSDSKQRRALIIDDNKTVRKMIAALLKREKIDVDQAENGKEGLDKVHASPPDFVICDLRMPEMDGREFLLKMKDDPKTRDIPVVILTVDDNAENEVELINSGACEFLYKGTNPAVLTSRIQKVLTRMEKEGKA